MILETQYCFPAIVKCAAIVYAENVFHHQEAEMLADVKTVRKSHGKSKASKQTTIDKVK